MMEAKYHNYKENLQEISVKMEIMIKSVVREARKFDSDFITLYNEQCNLLRHFNYKLSLQEIHNFQLSENSGTVLKRPCPFLSGRLFF